MTTLITGACGQVGQAVIGRLHSAGLTVRAASADPTGTLLGRPARTYRQWAREHAPAFTRH
ncbi:hypothetical protein [Kitasatospora sp. NPDC059827]|uniref:hypothetical protein n=1 Tax=Kitasatospora sp. NPDC059827 TaxID=3346964 RepID=UPI003648105F